MEVKKLLEKDTFLLKQEQKQELKKSCKKHADVVQQEKTASKRQRSTSLTSLQQPAAQAFTQYYTAASPPS